jgi:hypothetical protein
VSNYYDLKCLDCDARSGWNDGNRMHRELLLVTKIRPELEALGLAVKRLGEDAPLGWWPDALSPPMMASFFAAHVGHVVVVASEYWNDAYFGCDGHVDEEYKRDTGPRENTRDCRLDFNHEGPHARTRPDGK